MANLLKVAGQAISGVGSALLITSLAANLALYVYNFSLFIQVELNVVFMGIG
jgi:hypothetical protein